MQHFFVTPDQIRENEIRIEGTDVNHIKNVLRMKMGEQLEISDGNNRKYLCTIAGFDPDAVKAEIVEEYKLDTELPSRIYLFQGLPKSDKMDLIVQKAVELGAYEIIPVEMKRSVVRLDEKKAKKKTGRWNEIAKSAAKQAGRGMIPQVLPVMKYKDALGYAGGLDIVLLPYELERGMEDTRHVIGGIRPGQSIGIFIGPEGGFETEEISLGLLAGAKTVTLGRRILRTETAGLSILSILMYHLEM